MKKLPVILFVIILFSCAGFGNLSPVKKQLAYRTAFNHILAQFNDWAIQQPEETKVKLRSDVIPQIDKAASALDKYEAAYVTGDKDPQAKLDFYLSLKNDLIKLLLQYGLKVDEKEVSSGVSPRNITIRLAQSNWGYSYQSQLCLH
jgi:hypothetical protein